MYNQNLKVGKDRHKIYADFKRNPKEFQLGDHVYIKVNPKKSTLILGKYKKLAPRSRIILGVNLSPKANLKGFLNFHGRIFICN